ncbi:glycosyltransferase family 4 protein [Dietzia sp. SLG310A2-38A2]|uniref:glycosyltransferase family 4 protein n=1 Tax=Dietzia sp. SLG310A2-38A2 TaxID=1630643 RepID=UPI0015FB9645|nr:glycosyltransferase family 4 protein [Dietzia sp. SLG310A2-38A2]MBB1032739.1 glycosyltransferase family 4 protein [Dietzia sp. SLG310A2-38A2]
MKLLYGFTAPQSARGFLRGQAEYMDSKGYDVHVAASPGPELDECRRLYPVKVHEIVMSRDINIPADLKAFVEWLRLLRTHRPDVVNFGTPKASLLAALASFLARTPRRVYVVRGLRFEGETGKRRRLLIWIERIISACATDIVVVSESVGYSMRASCITRKPLMLIGSGSSNGVDSESWKSRVNAVPATSVRESLEVSPVEFVVLFVGRINADKGISTVIEMCKWIRDASTPVKVIAVGRVDSETAARTLRESGANVLLVEYQRDLAPLYSIADVLILPTKREGFPNVVLEAAAVGIPTITTRATGAIDSIVEGETGFAVDIDDGREMANRVLQLAANPDLRRGMGEAASDRAAEKFRQTDIWQGLTSIYEGRPSPNVTLV